MYPRLHNHNTSSSIVIAIKIAKCPAKDPCLRIAKKSKRNQLSRTTHCTIKKNAASRVFCGHHIVALHSFFFIKSTLVVRWCVHVSIYGLMIIIRTHLTCKMPCKRPVFQIEKNPKEISWLGQHISRLSRMLLAGCSVDFTMWRCNAFSW